MKHFGRLDVLVNVAGGLTTYGPSRTSRRRTSTARLSINLKTALLMSRAALPHLAESRGCIVNFASVAVLYPQPHAGPLRRRQGGRRRVHPEPRRRAAAAGIRVNAVAPGMVRTADNVATAGANATFVEMQDITARCSSWPAMPPRHHRARSGAGHHWALSDSGPRIRPLSDTVPSPLGDVVVIGGGCYGTFYAGSWPRPASGAGRLPADSRGGPRPPCRLSAGVGEAPDRQLVVADWDDFLDRIWGEERVAGPWGT